MAEFFNVRITYMDGKQELIQEVTHATVEDGVLTLRQSYFAQLGFREQHIGGFPLHNVRNWKREDR
jgi:hypothetical protein